MTIAGTQQVALDRWGFSGLTQATRSIRALSTPHLDGANDAVISVGGRNLVNLAGIGVLGWQHDPDVRDAFVATAQEYGLVVGGSRMAQGISRPHRELEQLTARSPVTKRPSPSPRPCSPMSASCRP